MREIRACLICGDTSFTELYSPTFGGNIKEATSCFLAQRKYFAHGRIVCCEGCGFVFTNPQFEVEDYRQIYEGACKATEPLNDIFSRAEETRARRLARILAKHSILNETLFDFGCGHGGFLRTVNAREKFGFEVTELVGHRSNNAKIFTGDFLSMMGRGVFTNHSFDVITTLDVLEHLPMLDIYLEAFSKLVRKGGALLVTVPNVESFSAKLFRSRWGLFLLEHLWYFSPDTLRNFIESFGWQRIDYGYIPYDVPISHMASRLSQMFGISLPGSMGGGGDFVIPVPVGLMYGVFRKL